MTSTGTAAETAGTMPAAGGTYPEETGEALPHGIGEALAGPAGLLRELHGRLAENAAAGGLLDVAYRVIESPVGRLLLAVTERGLLRIAYEFEDHDHVLEDLAERVSPRLLHAPRRVDPAARELDEYFSGHRMAFDLPLDRALSGGYRLEVQQYLASIPYGRTLSYGEVAEATGRPRAVRAVGSACAKNPLPVVVPCHRVLHRDGTTGGYLGGIAAKEWLLHHERSHAQDPAAVG
jgi:methylated-DNA-[protein]-cysteine S-methyltransferase